MRQFPVKLNFLITDFSSVDWRPFADIQYIMNIRRRKCIRAARIGEVRADRVRARVYTRSVEFLKIIYVYLQKSNIPEEEIRTPRAKWRRLPFTVFT